MRPISPFSYYLRTGRRLPPPDPIEKKFNPWHDSEDGKFTFEGRGEYFGGGRTGARLSQPRTGTFRQAKRIVPSPVADPMRRLAAPNRPPFLGQDSSKPARTFGSASQRFAQESIPDHVIQRFKQHLVPIEDDRNDVYRDSRKFPTVGIGHKVTPTDNLKLGDIISNDQKEAFFREDSSRALLAAQRQMKDAGINDPTFLIPLADVHFQLGTPKWKTFKKTWALIELGDYKGAAQEVQKSDWFNQTPKRVKAFQQALLTLPPKKHP